MNPKYTINLGKSEPGSNDNKEVRYTFLTF